jgi:hypothetical protein
MNVTVEGKDLKVKLGTSKKEHMDAALKQVKAAKALKLLQLVT